ncbi:MAG TPA: gamma-glutamyltransferase, partial [Fusibacter sp.]|nr:gamma-glutamyltransferase [Fusibacter sp.]
KITVEPLFSQEVVKELIAKGHEVTVESDSGGFGRGQIIWRTADGTYCGGTESRCDGHIASL